MLRRWLVVGWAKMYGRTPAPDDLSCPSSRGGNRNAGYSYRCFRQDLEVLGMRARRHYESRRTFITLGHAAKHGLTVASSAAVLLDRALDGAAAFPPVDSHVRRLRRQTLLRKYDDAVTAACDELGLPRFHPSWMRHTHIHYAVELGARIAATEKEAQARAAAYVGHAPDSRMVAIHYAKSAIPPKPPSIMEDNEEEERTPAVDEVSFKRGQAVGAEPAGVVIPLRRRE